MPRVSPLGRDALGAGRIAHERFAWDEAYTLLSEAGAAEALSAADLELLAESARWSGRHMEGLSALERAHGAHEAEGNVRAAARVALLLCALHYERGEDAVAGGWHARASRLLEGCEESGEYAQLRLALGFTMLRSGAAEESVEIMREAVELARRVGDRGVEGLAMVNLANGLVATGQVVEAFGLVDEANALAQGGRLGLDTTGRIFCNTLHTCRNGGDWKRAGEWTEASIRWCREHSLTGFPGICRFHRAEVLRMRGALDGAQRDTEEAIEELRGASPRFEYLGWGELGEIHRRRGDRDAAGDAFRRCIELGGEAESGWFLMRATEGDAPGALHTLRRRVAEGDAFIRDTSGLLTACVTVALAADEIAAAREALADLERFAAQGRSGTVAADAMAASGHVALACGEFDPAINALRGAVARYFEVRAPYEAARARVLLAHALEATGDAFAAGLEREAAHATLERMGGSLALDPVVSLSLPSPEPTLMTFMFTDMVGSTQLLDTLTDEGWNELLARHDALVREQFVRRGGREIKHEGDGFFVAFADAASAIEAGCAIQRALAEHRAGDREMPPVRVGIHTASATSRGRDFIGRGVHQAARLVGEARGGEVLVSAPALVAAGDTYVGCEPRDLQLRGFRAPLRVVSVEH